MAKAIKTVIKLQLEAGKATPAPPVGTALGPHGLNISDFVKKFNDATKEKLGEIVPIEITVFEDRSFTFVLKLPPVSELIKQELQIKSGAKTPSKEVVGTLTKDQVRKIAEKK